MGVSEERAADERNIRTLLERWAKAVRARDYPAILTGHAADMRMFDVPPPFESKGLEEYRRTWDLFFSTSEDPVVFDFDEMEITAGRDVAFVVARMHCEPTEAGKRARLDFRLTVGLRKDPGGGWVISHEHHSVPAT
jgi:ketosteroid isomerase-like protein